MDKAYEDVLFRKVGEYLQKYDSGHVQRESFDFFITHRLSKIIEEEPVIEIPINDSRTYNIHFGQVFIDRPYIIDENRHIRYIHPNEARLRDLTYSSLISINLHTFIKDSATQQESDHQDFYKVSLARIPMMLGTTRCNLYGKTPEQKIALGECPYDNGGYFIIKGKERVLVSQERINYNIVHVFDMKTNNKFHMISEIRSMSEETGHSVLLQMKITSCVEKKVMLQIPYVSQEIPLGFIFTAFGFSTGEIAGILDLNLEEQYKAYPQIRLIAQKIIREAEMIGGQEKAIAYIAQFSIHSLSKDRRHYYIHQILNNELFPHLGISSTREQKGYFLGHMLAKLLFTLVGKRALDDRDHVSNKRLETGGHLMAELFRTLFKRFVRSMEPQLVKRPDILVVMSRNNTITQGIKHCFSTGNWGVPKSNYIRTGVSQVMSRLTHNSFLSHLRRILVPIGKEGKNTKIRQLHPSQVGFICPFETPEGHCLTADTKILMSDGMSQFRIDELAENTALSVKTTRLEDGLEEPSGIRGVRVFHPERLYGLTTVSNRTIRCSGKHPFLVLGDNDKISWTIADDLRPGSMMAMRYTASVFTDIPVNRWCRFMGLCRAFHGCIPDSLSGEIVNEDARRFGVIVPDTYDNIIPPWIGSAGSVRDFLAGLFCGLGVGIGLSETECYDVSDAYFPAGRDWAHRLAAWRLLVGRTRRVLGIRIDLVSDREKDRILLSPRRTAGNLCRFIDVFGFCYDPQVERDLFVFAEYLRSGSTTPFRDWVGSLVYYHDRLVFMPLQAVTPLPVEPTFDLTTVSENHNYVANGFLTHNSAGIVKNMTLTTRLTTKLNPVFIRITLEEIKSLVLGFTDRDRLSACPYKVFMDGDWIGSTTKDGYGDIMRYKRTGRLPAPLSVSINEKDGEILLFTDEGRMIRPLLNAHDMPTIEDLRENSIEALMSLNKILLVDSYEIENNVVAMFPSEVAKNPFYTLCEIHPSLLVGLCVGLIPYSDHTQAPRITYHAAMGKQAIGVYATTHNIRTDTIVHTLHYPERPLVQTHIGAITGNDKMVFGSNLVVAVAMYTGFNQEDSVIMNRAAVDRGLFRSFAFRTIHVEEKKKSTSYTEDITLPPPEIRSRSYNYAKLDKNGIVMCGAYVGSNDVIVGKVQTKHIKTGGDVQTDTSVVIRNGEDGYVDRVFVSTSPEGYRIVKVKISSQKIPEIGDKVASRSAQKGTIGMIYNQEDMPFCAETGMIPDLIINPLCLPSRMTINQIIECIAAKSCAWEGKYRYATPFSSHSTGVVDSLCESLVENGFTPDGKEVMNNGFTGESFAARIFIGPTFYHRLKHLVSAKIHARNNGNLQALTRQPVEGRSRDGGLRFGEMERDCHVSVPISLKQGLSIMLGTMEGGSWEVLGWDAEKKGIVPGRQIGFLNKGERECVRITCQDGRTLVCTPDHPMLTSDGWLPAQDLQRGVSRLMCSVSYPIMDIKDEIAECKGWTYTIGSVRLDTGTPEDLMRSFAFVRILGLLVTDGSIYRKNERYTATISLGHEIDVSTLLDDLRWFCDPSGGDFFREDRVYSCYTVPIPADFVATLVRIPGILVGKRVEQESTLPDFLIREDCPRPIVREFLAAMFGGDGHTCVLGMHRGKRDILMSVSFSKSRVATQSDSLVRMMKDITRMLHKCGIHKITLQELKETSVSKKKQRPEAHERCFQSTLHLDISEVIPFHDKVGFRHCSHKTVRLEAAVAYRRLRENVVRQHNWIVERVDQITRFSEIKKKYPTKIVGTKKAILQAVDELQSTEPLIHPYAIPTTHDITDHLIKGTSFGKFTSKNFPTAEEFLKQIGAYSWFVREIQDEGGARPVAYETCRSSPCIPVMELTVLDVRPCGKEVVYDIEVDRINSFLADGVVAHNCMISHGVSRFLAERLFDMSDVFSVPVCCSCGCMPHALDVCNMCDSTTIRRVRIPYACKLLFQELMAMGIRVGLFVDKDEKYLTEKNIGHL
jgi:DNA-directed RNA polymerase beta subunit/intein/homing endonuclease